MTQLASNIPKLDVPFLSANGNINTPWLMFLVQLYQRTGGNDTPPLSLTQVQAYAASLQIATANGFAGVVDGSLGYPVVSIETTVHGITKGDGTTLSAAVPGTDYAVPPTGNSILYGDGSGGFSNVTIGANLTFSGGTLSASGGGSSSPYGLAFAAAHG